MECPIGSREDLQTSPCSTEIGRFQRTYVWLVIHGSIIAASPALTYTGLFQTPVGMTSVMLHDDPSIFPKPRSFQPERWLQPSTTQLRKYLVTFSKGSRQCLGLKYVTRLWTESYPPSSDDENRPLIECPNHSLAYWELYLTLAAIFAPSRFRFELYETDVTDVDIAHDFFNPCYKAESKGMRVVVH